MVRTLGFQIYDESTSFRVQGSGVFKVFGHGVWGQLEEPYNFYEAFGGLLCGNAGRMPRDLH